MIKIIKIFLLILFIGFAGYLLLHLDQLTYGYGQLKGQLQLIMNARPVEEVLSDNKVPEEIKTKLRLIQLIRKYATDSLGLKESENYTTYYDQKNKPVLWVLTAAYPLELKAYQWEFPFLGKVPYKGFFVEEKGKKEQELLKKKVLDTEISPTGGWSTLGWFKDPVLSNMLKRDEGRIAELIIHELTHETIYLLDSVDYNENLATFIGEQGAIRFLKYYYGENSKELKNYINFKSDEELFGKYMLQSANSLDSLYKTFGKETFREKLLKKNIFILQIVNDINKLPLHNKSRYQFHFPGNKIPNNTWFMGYLRYRGKQTGMEHELLTSDGNLRIFIQNLLKK
jgi:predicted aminopeptidase